MVRKTKFFEEDLLGKLQEQVNNFLDTLPQYNVVDVKYNHYHDPRVGKHGNMWYTALVIYSDNKEPDSVPAKTMVPLYEPKS